MQKEESRHVLTTLWHTAPYTWHVSNIWRTAQQVWAALLLIFMTAVKPVEEWQNGTASSYLSKGIR